MNRSDRPANINGPIPHLTFRSAVASKCSHLPGNSGQVPTKHPVFIAKMSVMSNAVEEIEKHGFASAPLEPDANYSEILHNLFSAPYQNRFITHYFPEIEYFKLN